MLVLLELLYKGSKSSSIGLGSVKLRERIKLGPLNELWKDDFWIYLFINMLLGYSIICFAVLPTSKHPLKTISIKKFPLFKNKLLNKEKIDLECYEKLKPESRGVFRNLWFGEYWGRKEDFWRSWGPSAPVPLVGSSLWKWLVLHRVSHLRWICPHSCPLCCWSH